MEMYLVDLEKARVQKLYAIDETGTDMVVYAVDVEDIKKAPVVDPEDIRTHGFWVMEYFDDGRVKSCCCSECGTNNYLAPAFCLTCGARMDKKLQR